MPHVEPYMVRAIRAALEEPGLDPELRAEAETWVAQETAHHGAHVRFNRLLLARQPALGRVDRWMGRAYGWLERRGPRFNLAFAAGAETVAFLVARWVDRRSSHLFRGADRTATTLFLWHLAEEVEHKDVAFDVHRARGGGRIGYGLGMAVALLVTAWFTALGTLVGLAGARRLLHPLAHLRMAVWTVGFWFEAAPALAGALVAGHHPSDLADPVFLPRWLQSYDPGTRTMPEWSMDLVEATTFSDAPMRTAPDRIVG